MRCRIIFCVAVSSSILLVVLLALFSPLPRKTSSRPWFALSLYIQQPQIRSSNAHLALQSSAGALVFHRMLTQGPENTSWVMGKAQGFIIPIEKFADSAFNIIHFTFDMPHYSGTLSVQAKEIVHKDKEQHEVVGGTGYFAFARGHAVITQADLNAIYQVKLQLRFPNQFKKRVD